MVVIQLLEFHNLMNIVTNIDHGDREYCCCDTPDTCESQSDFYNDNITCEIICETFFVASFCNGNSEPYSISTIKTTKEDSPSDSPYGKNFSFALHDFPNVVSNLAKMYNLYAFENACIISHCCIAQY